MNAQLCVLVGGGDYLCYRADDASEDELPGIHMPLTKVASWFERNGSLKSHDELIPLSNEKAAHLAGGCCDEAAHDHVKAAMAANSFVDDEAKMEGNNNISNNNNVQPLTRTASRSIPTSVDVNVSIYPLGSPPSSLQAPAGTYLLVTETTHHKRQPTTKLSYFTISNCIGYWISDYCGLGGFRQVVFYPQRKNDQPCCSPCDAIQNLEQFLLQGAILTDGVDLWFSSAGDDTIEVKQVSLSSWIYEGLCIKIVLPPASSSLAPFTQPKPSPEETTVAAQRDDKNAKKRPVPGDFKADWRITLERSLAKQFQHQQQERENQELVERSRDYVLTKSHEALQQLMQNDYGAGTEASSSNNNQPAITAASGIRLTEVRYRVYPSTSRQLASTSVHLWMEVDLMVPINKDDFIPNHVKSAKEKVVMRNAHSYCTPVASQSKGCWQNGDVVSECQSAVAPTLSCGDHVTLLLSVTLDNLVLTSAAALENDRADTEKEDVELTLGLIGLIPGPEGHPDCRCGLNLGSFLLPARAILQAPFGNTTFRYTFATKRERRSQIQPSTIYECRPPRRLKLDVSGCPDFSLSDFLRKFNQLVSDKCPVRVDKSEKQGTEAEYILCLTIFAMTRSEVSGLVPFILSQLPGHAKILGQTSLLS